VPSADAERFSRLRAMFSGQGCTHIEEEPVGHHAGNNLICTLPGNDAATILVVAHFEHEGKGAGAVENWSGAAMLPLLLHALSATPRNHTFVFAAVDGARGARTFMNNRRATRRQFRAMFALEDLGLGPAKYCAFNWAPLQEFGLAQFLSDASTLLHPDAPLERTGCPDLLKIDDTRVFREVDIPALVIHSMTLSERSLPGSAADTAAAINGDSYYESYQLMATYLAALDRVVEQALAGGQFASSASLATGSERRPINGSAIAAPATTSAAKEESSPILVDVVVTDKRGAPVPHLRQEDFAVLEDHHAQTITSFEEHPVNVTPLIVPIPPPDSFTNAPPAQPSDAVNILLLDRLNTPPERKPMISYLKTIPPGMHLAVFGLGSHLWMVQGANADSSLLRAAIDGKDNQPSLPPAASIGNGSPSGRQTLLIVNRLRAFQLDTPGFPFDVRTRLTLAAFQQLARYLSGIPGRKNIVWFSQLFPLSSQALALAPETRSAPRHETDADYATLLRPTLDLLASARVAIYPVDSTGVPPPSFSMRPPGQVEAHDDMKLFAENTGGEAFYDADQLKEALERVQTVSEHYYTLAYQPTSTKPDGRFHNIVIMLNDGNYKLNYRRGYYADNPPAAPASAVDQLDPSFETALAPGIPPATQILFTVRATRPASQLTPGTLPYTLVYAANPQGVRLDEGANHQRHGHLIFAAAAYDAHDKLINSFWHALPLDLGPAEYAQAQTSGIFFQKEFDVPEGTIALRVAVFDPASGGMGALDIPLSPAVTKP
jgi:VWFA-related protein